jgi:hypothetical protein
MAVMKPRIADKRVAASAIHKKVIVESIERLSTAILKPMNPPMGPRIAATINLSAVSLAVWVFKNCCSAIRMSFIESPSSYNSGYEVEQQLYNAHGGRGSIRMEEMGSRKQ